MQPYSQHTPDVVLFRNSFCTFCALRYLHFLFQKQEIFPGTVHHRPLYFTTLHTQFLSHCAFTITTIFATWPPKHFHRGTGKHILQIWHTFWDTFCDEFDNMSETKNPFFFSIFFFSYVYMTWIWLDLRVTFCCIFLSWRWHCFVTPFAGFNLQIWNLNTQAIAKIVHFLAQQLII